MKHLTLCALLAATGCGGPAPHPPGAPASARPHVPGDVDGDGQADQVSFEDGVVTLGARTFAVPPGGERPVTGARVVELGNQAVVALAYEEVEDDLTWGLLQVVDGQLRHIGDVFLGDEPSPAQLPGDGTIHARTASCGQTTDLTYVVRPGKVERREHTSGTYDEGQCAACPYVLVDTPTGRRFVGEALRNLASPARAAEDALALPALAAGQRELTVVLEEVKPETTYLDALAVDFGGVRVAPRACAAACAHDDRHEVFRLGERRTFVFDVPAGFTGAPVLYARGYYQPFAPTTDAAGR